MTRPLLLAWLHLLLCVVGSQAHDYWLQPDSFFPAPGDAVTVRLHVGDHFSSEAERPFSKKATVTFQLLSARETRDLAAGVEDGQTPVATVKLPAGTHLIALERGWTNIKLEAGKFNDYLKEEGLDAVLEQRRKDGQDKEPGRERYSRHLKCLLQAGDAADDTFKKVLGQRLEIVPDVNPATLKPGDKLPVRVLFDGKPLAGAQVSAYHREGDKLMTLTARTTDEGLATFKLDKSGPWLVRLVHMRRCTDSADADWESFWAALSLGIK
jgi:uncharacterized GH25 family protein